MTPFSHYSLSTIHPAQTQSLTWASGRGVQECTWAQVPPEARLLPPQGGPVWEVGALGGEEEARARLVGLFEGAQLPYHPGIT